MPLDFSGQNLRGCSFKGQNLAGANFSGADIRGADFSGANLRGANFRGTKAGLQKRWLTFLVIICLLLSGLLGFFSAWTGSFLTLIFSTEYYKMTGWVSLISLVSFFFVTIRQGIGAGLGVLAAAGVLAVGIAFTLAAPIAGVLAGAVNGVVALAVALAGSSIGSVALAGVSAKAVILTGTLFGALAFGLTGTGGFVLIAAEAFAVVGAVILFGAYVDWQAIKGNKKYTLIWNLAIAFAAISGTSFRDADLSDADFTEATLKSTDFRKATLTCTRWHQAKKLDRVRPGSTYLQNEQVRQLIITGEGKNKNFDRLDLRGLNVREADLENASLIDADLYQANLSNANLSRAILVRTNFERADLRGACLTGSCIQDWTISRGTKLDGIICDYVYLKWVDEDKRDQMPHRGKFKKGGFVLFAKYILDTIDIYHNKDINPRLALSVLKKMSRDYDEPLDIVAVGKRGDKVFIKVKLSETVEPEQFKENYFSRYESGLKLISSSSRALPSVDELVENKLTEIASDTSNEISSINVTHIEYLNTPKDLLIQGEVTVESIEAGGDTINQSGSFGVGVNKGEIKNVGQVDFMSNNPGGISQNMSGGQMDGGMQAIQGNRNQQNMKNKTSNFDLRNAQFAGGLVDADTVTAHQIGGNITNYTPQQRQNLAEAAAEIQQLLNQLSQTYPTTTASEKMTVVAKAVDEIENNPTLKVRVIGALKSGGTEAFKELIDNPLINILLASIEGWQEAE